MKFKLILSNSDSVTTKELTPLEVKALKETISMGGAAGHLLKVMSEEGREIEIAPAHVIALYPE